MRAFLPDYYLEKAKSLDDVLSRMSAKESGEITIIAGGTDLMVRFADGTLSQRRFLSIEGIKELRNIMEGKDRIEIGTLVTFSEIRDDQLIKKYFPLLSMAAREIGGVAIQNRATIGGNIMNASPAADSPPVLIVYDACLKLVSKRGSRIVELNDFYLDYKKMFIEKDEILQSVIIKKPALKLKGYFRKVGPRKAMAISKVVIAGVGAREKGAISHIRLSFGSLAPTVVQIKKVENFLLGKKLNSELIKDTKEILYREISPIGDIRSTAEYRKVVAGNLLEQCLETIFG